VRIIKIDFIYSKYQSNLRWLARRKISSKSLFSEIQELARLHCFNSIFKEKPLVMLNPPLELISQRRKL
jgi:hypothetical protein